MRPTESVGVAAGEDEDEDGAVRSEGSGPQSWAIVPTVTAAAGDLRRPLPPGPVSDTQER